jgi:hypothetical protein
VIRPAVCSLVSRKTVQKRKKQNPGSLT